MWATVHMNKALHQSVEKQPLLLIVKTWTQFYNLPKKSIIKIVISDSVKSITDYAFRGCSALSRVDIPKSVTSIGVGAFCGCIALNEMYIPNSVTFIGAFAFCECSALSRVDIPNSVTDIGDRTFYKCISLTKVHVPNSVTSIVDRAFNGCSALIGIHIPSSVTYIGCCAFKDCSVLTKVNIPNSVTSIDYSAFEGCSHLRSAIILCQNDQSQGTAVMYSRLLKCVKRLSILVVPVTELERAKINDYFPRCRVLRDGPYARIKAAQAPYWNIHGMSVSDINEQTWLLIVLMTLERYFIREKTSMPTEMICSILKMIEWLSMTAQK